MQARFTLLAKASQYGAVQAQQSLCEAFRASEQEREAAETNRPSAAGSRFS